MQQENNTPQPQPVETEGQGTFSSSPRIIEETVPMPSQPPVTSYQQPQAQYQQPQQAQYQQPQAQYQQPQAQYQQPYQQTTYQQPVAGQQYYQQPYQQPVIAGNGTGIAAVVLGALALFNGLCFGWTLILGGFAIILGIAGIILGIVSISQHKSAYGNNPVPGKGKGIAGIVISIIAIVLSIAEIAGVCWLAQIAIDNYDYDGGSITLNGTGNESWEDFLDNLENELDDAQNSPNNHNTVPGDHNSHSVNI